MTTPRPAPPARYVQRASTLQRAAQRPLPALSVPPRQVSNLHLPWRLAPPRVPLLTLPIPAPTRQGLASRPPRQPVDSKRVRSLSITVFQGRMPPGAKTSFARIPAPLTAPMHPPGLLRHRMPSRERALLRRRIPALLTRPATALAVVFKGV